MPPPHCKSFPHTPGFLCSPTAFRPLGRPKLRTSPVSLHLFRPFFSFLLLFSSPFRYEEANIGNFPLKVPRFSSKVPHFRAFTPAFCRAPRTAHPPCAIRCIFPPHLRSATGGKRTSSIYSCTTSSDAGVPFPFRCRKVPSFLTTMRPLPRLLASFAFKILLQLVQSLLTRPYSPVASPTITLSSRSSTRLSSPLIGDTFSRHDTKSHDSHNNSMPILPFCHSNSIFVV